MWAPHWITSYSPLINTAYGNDSNTRVSKLPPMGQNQMYTFVYILSMHALLIHYPKIHDLSNRNVYLTVLLFRSPKQISLG